MMTTHLDWWRWEKNVEFCFHYCIVNLILLEMKKYFLHVSQCEFSLYPNKCFILLFNYGKSPEKELEFEFQNFKHQICLKQHKFEYEFILICNKTMSSVQPAQKREEEILPPQNITSGKSVGNRISPMEVDSHQPLWLRRDSFSSCSSDSAVYCSSRHAQGMNCEESKRPLPGRRSNRLAKRHRNSSGSSVSSNVSCISEKESKGIPECPPTSSLNNCTTNIHEGEVQSVPSPRSVKPPLLASSSKVETVIEERISYSCNSETVNPYQHNLRRNIRKKTCCNCDCAASRTTVVVRRFTQISHETVEKQTVVPHSSLKTASPSETVKKNYSCSDESSVSKSLIGKKRRSEVDKLYDALHEIKWASHFSPDNILSQIDVRRAASCSVFSKTSNKPVPKHKTSFVVKDLSNKNNSFKNSNVFDFKRNLSSKLNNRYPSESSMNQMNNTFVRTTRRRNYIAKEMLPTENTALQSARVGTRFSNRINVSSESAEGIGVDRGRSNKRQKFDTPKESLNLEIESDHQKNIDINFCPQTEKSSTHNICDSPKKTSNSCSEIEFSATGFPLEQDKTECSSICNATETSVQLQANNTQLIPRNQSDAIDLKDFSDGSLSSADASSNKCEDIYIVHEKIVESESKHCSIQSDSSSDINTNSCLMSSTFLDITEEAIQTIDACFREVVNEVEISSCNSSAELPHLTSANEVLSPIKEPRSDDGPPLLELCTVSSSDCEALSSDSEAHCSNTFMAKSQPVALMNEICDTDRNEIRIISMSNHQRQSCNKCFNNKSENLCLSRKQFKRTASQNASRRIIKKYLNNLLSKQHVQKTPKSISNSHIKEGFAVGKDVDIVDVSSNSDRLSDLEDFVTDSSTNYIEKRDDSLSCQNNVCESAEFQISNLSELKTIPQQNTYEKIYSSSYSPHFVRENVANHSFFKSTNVGSTNYHSNTVAHTSLQVTTMESKNTLKPTSANNYCSLKYNNTAYLKNLPRIANKETEEGSNEDALRLSISSGFTFHYKAITVNRNESYTQIVLKITRGKSIFLTIEALTELRHAVTGASNDARCQVLIINGIGESFCSGLDLQPLIGNRKVKAATEIAIAVKELIEALADFHKPLVAVVNGDACGLGVTLLNHADVSIASDQATFCMPYVHLGYAPEGGATLTLPQAVGSTVAMDLLLRGRVLTAQEACHLGLVSDVLEAKRLPHELVSRVRVLVENPISAMETTKALLRMRLLQELRAVLENEVNLLPRMWLSGPCQEALNKAFSSGLIHDTHV